MTIAGFFTSATSEMGSAPSMLIQFDVKEDFKDFNAPRSTFMFNYFCNSQLCNIFISIFTSSRKFVMKTNPMAQLFHHKSVKHENFSTFSLLFLLHRRCSFNVGFCWHFFSVVLIEEANYAQLVKLEKLTKKFL